MTSFPLLSVNPQYCLEDSAVVFCLFSDTLVASLIFEIAAFLAT